MADFKFRLEDGSQLQGNCEEGSKYVDFILKDGPEGVHNFRLHKIQVQALLKAINQPMDLGLDLSRR